MFSDVLLTVDVDRTLTGPDAKIPQRNLDAIDYFINNGGTFTINTGRSVMTMKDYMDILKVNAPMLLYNGSAAYEKGGLSRCKIIDLDMWSTIRKMAELFPDMNLELQGEQVHYLVNPAPDMVALYEKLDWRYTPAVPDTDIGPFLKFTLFGKAHRLELANMYDCLPGERERFDEAEQTIRRLYGDKVAVFRAAPRIIDVHAKGVSKLNAALQLKQDLGKKILVCVGDGENDVPMLDGADYGFCPADAVVAARYENVCPCGEGAVAEVIYKKIREILKV